MKKFLFFILLNVFTLLVFAQDIDYAREVIDNLCSKDMFGRGYINAGDKKAAYYIENEFKKFNILPYEFTTGTMGSQEGRTVKKYQQEFKIKVNAFPGDVLLSIDQQPLKVGEDFLVAPNSGPIESIELDLVYLNKKALKDESSFDAFLSDDYTAECLVVDMAVFQEYQDNAFFPRVLKNEMRANAIMLLVEGDLMWGVANTFDKFPTFIVKKSKMPKKALTAEVKLDTKFYYDYLTQNVIGVIKGKKYPDKYILIGAHYDHLGMLGKEIFFPGANDNASGVAMMLDLAKYFSDVFNQPDYSLMFVGFGAEEAGLLGSMYFVENPPVPLTSIRLMLNLDMLSTGEGGIMVVNTKGNSGDFNTMKTINSKKQYFPELGSRPEAAISDHHSFHVKKVPSLYIYLQGDPAKNYYYHGIGDVPSNISLSAYIPAFKLIADLIAELK